MPELTYKECLQLRQNYIGKSCKLHFESAPVKMVRASKQYMYDDAGTEYLDGINNVAHVGHCHPQVVHAGQQQMARLSTNFGFLTDVQGMYAKRLLETFPEPLNVCFLVNSGSEANDLALRLARAYTKKKDIICVDNAYHGNLGSLINISPCRFKKMQDFVKEDWVHVAPVPDVYRGIHRDTSNPGQKYATEVAKIITHAHANNRQIAGYISELTMTNAGVIKPPIDYFKLIYSIVRGAGGVCIADEIQTGLGRVGEHWWAFQHFDVVPDIVTCGKPMGNGHPMAAVVTSHQIADCLGDFISTYGGNPVACAIGLSVLDIIHNEKLMSAAKSVGRCLLEGFKAILPLHTTMGDVRGLGMVVGVEIVTDKESRKPSKEVAEMLSYKLKNDARMLVANDGPDKNVMTLVPPLCFTTDNAKQLVTKFDKLLKEIEDGLLGKDTSKSIDDGKISLDMISGIESDSDSDESEAKRARYDDVD
ncbi:unnamed protein product [Owenia fusiformis]|uniref:Uncharacterized protein n=1 Tax=Owenia fusiformis TaxID=6347 RepID=A0A8J1U845_OWEFU|nr:unnamed protein product [Owenia fusiformis]